MSTECGITGGIRANAGRALLKTTTCVVYTVYSCWESLPDGGTLFILLMTPCEWSSV